jgi:dipeptidyl aminopeptidase/acylaminoacyl peptidase
MEPASSSGAPPSAGTPRPYKYRPRVTDEEAFPKWKPRLRIGGIAAAAVVVLATAYYLFRKPSGEAAAVADARVPSVSQWTADPGLSIAPAFSHDGKLVAYASDRGGDGALAIWLRPFPSGEARRLSSQSFNDASPDFSPDDSRIVYRSERDGGGIYIVALTGNGQPRRLVTGGLRPRFSPDGKWIAYYEAGRVFIVSPEGGEPRRLQPEFLDSSFPVWSPDGQHLLFVGTDAGGRRDWWVTPIEGGAAKPTLALQTLSRVPPVVHAPERWHGGKILYSATEQQYPHLWEIGISSADSSRWRTPTRTAGCCSRGCVLRRTCGVSRWTRVAELRRVSRNRLPRAESIRSHPSRPMEPNWCTFRIRRAFATFGCGSRLPAPRTR